MKLTSERVLVNMVLCPGPRGAEAASWTSGNAVNWGDWEVRSADLDFNHCRGLSVCNLNLSLMAPPPPLLWAISYRALSYFLADYKWLQFGDGDPLAWHLVLCSVIDSLVKRPQRQRSRLKYNVLHWNLTPHYRIFSLSTYLHSPPPS